MSTKDIRNKAYLANPAKKENLVHFNTVWAENVAHVNIGTEDKPYYVPQEMFEVSDSFRELLMKNLGNGE
jgi:hypothetical protein